MDKGYSVGDLISLYYEKEFESIEESALPTFSSKHKKKMEKIFKAFEKNNAPSDNNSITAKSIRPLSVRQRIALVIVIIILMAIATGCVIAFISNSFRGTVYSDNTRLFAFDVSDSPGVIEEEFMLSIVPEGYKLSKVLKDSTRVVAIYKNDCDKELIFQQTVKSKYISCINTEGYNLQEIMINDRDGIYIEFVCDDFIDSLIIWNNEYYILELSGNFDKDSLINLAKNNEINGF